MTPNQEPQTVRSLIVKVKIEDTSKLSKELLDFFSDTLLQLCEEIKKSSPEKLALKVIYQGFEDSHLLYEIKPVEEDKKIPTYYELVFREVIEETLKLTEEETKSE